MVVAISDGNPLVHIRAPYVNRALVAANIALFVMVLFDWPWWPYAYVPAYLGQPGVWAYAFDDTGAFTLITHQFLHADLLHLAGNMVALWVFGDTIEDALGHIRYLPFYLLCGVSGALAESALGADTLVPMVGASAAISGVMGAYLLLHPRAKILVVLFFRVPLLLPAMLVVGADFASNLAMLWLPPVEGEVDLIAWGAHVGGFFSGMGLILVLRRPGVALFQPVVHDPEGPYPRLQTVVIDFFPDRRPSAGAPGRKRDFVAVALKAVAYVALIIVLLCIV